MTHKMNSRIWDLNLKYTRSLELKQLKHLATNITEGANGLDETLGKGFTRFSKVISI